MKKIRLMKNIGSISRCSTLYRDRQLDGMGLNGYQSPYVLELCKSPGITQDQLAQRIHVNRSSVTRQLALLEKNGYITRRRSEDDHRAIEVFPTSKMYDALPLVHNVLSDWYNLLTDKQLTDEELLTLEALLDKLAKRAEEVIS